MDMIRLRPVNVARDFARLANLFSLEQDEPTTTESLSKDYKDHRERIFRLMAAEDAQGQLIGFNWATRSRFDPSKAYFYVIVQPEGRGQGAGRSLYADLEQSAREAQIKTLQVDVKDDCPACRAFAERRGFVQKHHSIRMELDLTALDDRPYDAVIARLQGEGFRFTSMAELGNTEAAQRKLYALNDSAAMDTPGTDPNGEHPWLSFADFKKKVCGADWYIPAGQMMVIDTATGDWAAMSAITRFAGTDFAYNLFTGVDRRYRGRKLAQAVKVLALRFARQTLNVKIVQTNHNALNLPMIAIDRKLGYKQIPGIFLMEKRLE